MQQQSQPDPGWYPDPAGSNGVRWWDGYAWTEHVALPEAEPEPEPYLDNVVYMSVASTERPTLADDGLLHPKARDIVFQGAPRGPIESIEERRKLDARVVQGLLGAQLMGCAAVFVLCAWLAISGLLGDRSGYVIGAAIVVGALMPPAMRVIRWLDARRCFWLEWSASRGFEPGIANGPGAIVPKGLDRSPLFGPLEQRFVEQASRRLLGGNREAIVGSLARIVPAEPVLGENGEPVPELHTARAPSAWRSTFVVMPLPELVAARWVGASIRADHAAQRPPIMRALLGPLVSNGVPDAKMHLAAAAGQDPRWVVHVGDARLEQYLADHPVDVDIVGNLLVVMTDGMPHECNQLDELCRTAMLVHELLVAEHEVPAVVETPGVAMPEDQPVIDTSRAGWGESSIASDEEQWQQQDAA